jgi:DNA-binding transcriptional ArsR family regulator
MSFSVSDKNKGHSVPQKSDHSKPNPRPILGASESTPNIDRESRRSRILKLVKDKQEVMVKDITVHFPDLSEKTVQRELVALVETGVLKKAGERRWSRYSLV